MIKKIISLVLMLALATGIFNISLITASAETDKKFTYNIMDDGTAKITDYNDNDTKITIPEKIDGYYVTGIGVETFKDNQNITAISIPESIADIEEDTFEHLDNLTIHCYQDTYAESYAQEEKINYVLLIDKISLNTSKATLNTGNTKKLTASITPGNAHNKIKQWSSSNKKVATVDPSGKITAKSKGVAKITAKTVDGSKKFSQCKVIVKQPVKNIKINRKNFNIEAGKTRKLKAVASPANANNKKIKWKSSNKKIASVTKSGKVIAKSRGIAKITAKSTDGSKIVSKCMVKVNQPVTGLSLSKTETSLKVGQQIDLQATAKPLDANNRNIKWNTTNSNVATVTSTGTVVGKNEGSAYITATTTDGSKMTAKCSVNVKNAIQLTNREKDMLMRSLYREAGATSHLCKLYVCSATLNLWKKNYSHMSLERMLRSYNIFSTAYTLDSVTAKEKAMVKPAVDEILKYGVVSDVKYFRTSYYHGFGTPVTNINNVYFSK